MSIPGEDVPLGPSVVLLSTQTESHNPINESYKQCAKCGANVVNKSDTYFGHYLCNECGLHSKFESDDNLVVDNTYSVKKVELFSLFCQNFLIGITFLFRKYEK